MVCPGGSERNVREERGVVGLDIRLERKNWKDWIPDSTRLCHGEADVVASRSPPGHGVITMALSTQQETVNEGMEEEIL